MDSLELADLPRGTLSYSAYSMYLRCPSQYMYRYLEGLKMPPASNLILGRGTHKGIEVGFNEHLQTGRHPKLAIVEQAAAEAIDEEFRQVPPSEIEWKDDTIKLVNAYDPVRLSVLPESVEEPFELTLKDSSYKITGRIDLTTKENSIVDLKTSARTPAEDVAEKSDQLNLYQVARQAMGKEPQTLEIHALVRKAKPEVKVFWSKPRTSEQSGALLQNIEKVSLLIRTGIFTKASEDAFGTPCSFCGYYELCRGRKRP